jgi:hypothetical protein
MHIVHQLDDETRQLIKDLSSMIQHLLTQVNFSAADPGGCATATTEDDSPPTSSVDFPTDPPAKDVAPEEEPPPDSLKSMLKQASIPFRRRLLDASKDQQGKYRTAAKMFDLWWAERSTLHRSGGPVQGMLDACRADAQKLEPVFRAEFATWCLQQDSPQTKKPYSPQTVKTFWQCVCRILKDYGVAFDAWTLAALKDLRDSITGEAASLVSKERNCPHAEELDAMALHATAAKGPYGDHSPYFFRQVIRFCACYGLRTQDLVGHSPEKKGIRKQDLHWSARCPVDNVHASLGYELSNPHGWVTVKIWKARRSEEKMLLLPIPEFAVGLFRFFEQYSQHPERLFPSAYNDGRESLSSAAFNTQFGRIRKAAGVPDNIRLSEGRGGIIAIRKYAANWWQLHVAQHTRDTALAKNVRDYILHHKSVTKTVGDRNYSDVRSQVLPVIVELLPTFPVPAADAASVSMLPE